MVALKVMVPAATALIKPVLAFTVADPLPAFTSNSTGPLAPTVVTVAVKAPYVGIVLADVMIMDDDGADRCKKTDTLLLVVEFAITTSSLPSAFKSPTATLKGSVEERLVLVVKDKAPIVEALRKTGTALLTDVTQPLFFIFI